jgi:hypothetical protein
MFLKIGYPGRFYRTGAGYGRAAIYLARGRFQAAPESKCYSLKKPKTAFHGLLNSFHKIF